MSFEKENLGLYLSGHPIDVHMDEIRKVAGTALMDVNVDYGKKSVTIAGLIIECRAKITKRGDKMMFMTLDDQTARKELVVYQEQLDQFSELIQADHIVIVKATVSKNPHTEQLRITVEAIYSLDGVRAELAARLRIQLRQEEVDANLLGQLQQVLVHDESAHCHVHLSLATDNASVDFVPNQSWLVKPTTDMIKQLKRLCGQENFQLEY